eukprot:jgi/Bigna1/73309/fgenesh1_pg.23_\
MEEISSSSKQRESQLEEGESKNERQLRSTVASISYSRKATAVKVSDSISLETRVFRTDDFEGSNITIVLVHQWSILGGSMMMMTGMAGELAQRGYNTVVFNMRGVGGSSGTPTICGCDETADVEAVVKWEVRYIVEKHKGHKIYLVASSAGAPIAGTVLNRVDEIEGYIGIGYIFGIAAAFLFGGHYPGVLCSNKRRLFINGSCDMFTSVCEYLCCWCMMCGPRKTHTIPGVGHFEMEGPSYDSYMVDLIDKFVSVASAACMPSHSRYI